MRMRSFWGVRLWPAVLLVWVVRPAVVALPFAGVWITWMATRSWVAVIFVAVPDVGLVWGALLLAAELPEWLPHGVFLRYEIAAGEHREHNHAWLANDIARRDPRRAERMLRRGTAGGGLMQCVELIRLLRRQDRAGDLNALLADLAATGKLEQLRHAVWEFRDEPAIAAPLKGGVAARSDDDLDHELAAALLADIGAFDEATAAHGNAVRKRAGRDPGEASVEALLRTAWALSRAKRYADAERVLRAGGNDREVRDLLASVVRQRGTSAPAGS
ncbi:hypothetical protein [Dactylosporangium sp. NPDC049140]|uniref:hypothetical protein n=1 Tax=Dactylosporangium sp. NPDC049140 TaxID=3155647 RepID=UPI0033C1C955